MFSVLFSIKHDLRWFNTTKHFMWFFIMLETHKKYVLRVSIENVFTVWFFNKYTIFSEGCMKVWLMIIKRTLSLDKILFTCSIKICQLCNMWITYRMVPKCWRYCRNKKFSVVSLSQRGRLNIGVILWWYVYVCLEFAMYDSIVIFCLCCM